MSRAERSFSPSFSSGVDERSRERLRRLSDDPFSRQAVRGPAIGASQHQVRLARRRIEHVVFLIKENRTFDHMFGRFPGADGATSGVTCDGRRVPLRRAGNFPTALFIRSKAACGRSTVGG